MYSEKEIQKILRLKRVDIGKSKIVTDEDYLQDLLQFANIGNPTSVELDKPINDIDFLNFFINMDYSFTTLPKETPLLKDCMTLEKYQKVVDVIISKLKNGEKVIINEIIVELNYQILHSSIFLDG